MRNPNTNMPAAIRKYMAEIGRKGGAKKGPKGSAVLPKKKRQEIARAGGLARKKKLASRSPAARSG